MKTGGKLLSCTFGIPPVNWRFLCGLNHMGTYKMSNWFQSTQYRATTEWEDYVRE